MVRDAPTWRERLAWLLDEIEESWRFQADLIIEYRCFVWCC
jgi:hypothetical protein